MKKFLILLITNYRYFVSPVLASLGFSGCRFSRTCSEFALNSIQKYGVKKGLILTTQRIIHCHPFSKLYD